METVRLVVALACKQGWSTFHLEVKLIFLNGPLDEEVYVTHTHGFMIYEELRNVYKLHKALHGLKQTPMACNKNINSYLVELGFVKYRSECGIYAQVVAQDIIVIFLYVDDLLVIGNKLKNLSKFKDLIMREFEISDLGNLSYFVGMYFKCRRKV